MGAGDGVATFNLPDFRRRVTVGFGGAGSGILGNAVGNIGGEETHAMIPGDRQAIYMQQMESVADLLMLYPQVQERSTSKQV